jgi:hypothetical protein
MGARSSRSGTRSGGSSNFGGGGGRTSTGRSFFSRPSRTRSSWSSDNDYSRMSSYSGSGEWTTASTIAVIAVLVIIAIIWIAA